MRKSLSILSRQLFVAGVVVSDVETDRIQSKKRLSSCHARSLSPWGQQIVLGKGPKCP